MNNEPQMFGIISVLTALQSENVWAEKFICDLRERHPDTIPIDAPINSVVSIIWADPEIQQEVMHQIAFQIRMPYWIGGAPYSHRTFEHQKQSLVSAYPILVDRYGETLFDSIIRSEISAAELYYSDE